MVINFDIIKYYLWTCQCNKVKEENLSIFLFKSFHSLLVIFGWFQNFDLYEYSLSFIT